MGNWIDKNGKWFAKKDKLNVKKNNVNDTKFRHVVNFYIFKCPECESRRTRVYSTDLPLRYHICLACGLKFLSREVEPPENP